MRLGAEAEFHALAWTTQQSNGHVARGVLSYLMNQAENGVCCPLGMTYAAIPALRATESVRQAWEQHVLAASYDARYIPG
jgi:putative acyl-CoA dehydrogenase